MRMTSGIRHTGLATIAWLATGCVGTEALVDAPQVSLSNVEVADIDLDSQTFVLEFDVRNPNPFPLPVSAVSYGVELDGYRFANGQTVGAFTVPASGEGRFAISVDLNLMRTAPQLLFIVRDGVYREIPYELAGRFEVDIPLAPPVPFRSEGNIRLHADAVSAGHRH